jgi:hypothetical protein
MEQTRFLECKANWNSCLGAFGGELVVTGHAQTRLQQRGISRVAVRLISQHADRLVPLRGGREAAFVSRSKASKLRAAGVLSAVDLDTLSDRALVLGGDGVLVTAIALHGPKARYYTRDRRKGRRA